MLMRKWEQHKTNKWVRSSAYTYVVGVLTSLWLCYAYACAYAYVLVSFIRLSWYIDTWSVIAPHWGRSLSPSEAAILISYHEVKSGVWRIVRTISRDLVIYPKNNNPVLTERRGGSGVNGLCSRLWLYRSRCLSSVQTRREPIFPSTVRASYVGKYELLDNAFL